MLTKYCDYSRADEYDQSLTFTVKIVCIGTGVLLWKVKIII